MTSSAERMAMADRLEADAKTFFVGRFRDDLTVAARLLREPVAGEEWRSLAEAPKDGSGVDLLIIHDNAKYSADPLSEGWIAMLPGKWIDHHGGGWTWHGLAGKVSAWRPARKDQQP